MPTQRSIYARVGMALLLPMLKANTAPIMRTVVARRNAGLYDPVRTNSPDAIGTDRTAKGKPTKFAMP